MEDDKIYILSPSNSDLQSMEQKASWMMRPRSPSKRTTALTFGIDEQIFSLAEQLHGCHHSFVLRRNRTFLRTQLWFITGFKPSRFVRMCVVSGSQEFTEEKSPISLVKAFASKVANALLLKQSEVLPNHGCNTTYSSLLDLMHDKQLA